MGSRAYVLGLLIVVGPACGEKVDDQPGFGPTTATMSTTQGTDVTGGSSSSDSESSTTGASDSNSGGTTTTATASAGTSSTTGASTTGTTGNTTNTTGGGNCGNGTIDAGEQCDGADLNGFDCSSLGYTGGTLSCDAVTCTFDTSLCMSGTAGTTG